MTKHRKRHLQLGKHPGSDVKREEARNKALSSANFMISLLWPRRRRSETAGVRAHRARHEVFREWLQPQRLPGEQAQGRVAERRQDTAPLARHPRPLRAPSLAARRALRPAWPPAPPSGGRCARSGRVCRRLSPGSAEPLCGNCRSLDLCGFLRERKAHKHTNTPRLI